MKSLLILLCLLKLPTHDIQVAFFKIYQEQDAVSIDFVLEKEDVLVAFDMSEISFSQDNLKAYLDNNFSLTINDQKQNLEFGDLNIKNKHLYMQATLPSTKESIKSLHISNSCLLDIKGHSNIIEIRILDQERDFLMNVDRTKISVQY